MKRLYTLYSSKSDSKNLEDRIHSIEQACQTRNIQCISIDQELFDFSVKPELSQDDAVFNISRGARVLESFFLNEKVKSIYRHFPREGNDRNTTQLNMVLQNSKILLPKTIFYVSNKRSLRERYVSELNGFPLIVKVTGGSGGLGTMIVNSFEEYWSLTDYLLSINESFVLKEFISSDSVERYNIVGNQVFKVYSRQLPSTDFRSDGYARTVAIYDCPSELTEELQAICKASNLWVAGIDMIKSNKDGNNYLLEVNCPANFAYIEKVTGEKIYDAIANLLLTF